MNAGIRACTVSAAVLLAVLASSLSEGAVGRDEKIKMRIIAQNPDKEEPRKITIKEYLPPEITKREEVTLPAQLELGYDPEKATYFVTSKGQIEIPPLKNASFIVQLKNVWFIEEKELTAMERRAERALTTLQGTAEYDAAKGIAGDIGDRIEAIRTFQSNPAISKEDYIVGYRYNRERLEAMRRDIETVESYSKITGEPKPIRSKDDLVPDPTKKATWLVIFVILTFLGIMAGIFFYVWQRSARTMEGPLSEARRSAFPGSGEGGKQPGA